jgi:hypothetical protein
MAQKTVVTMIDDLTEEPGEDVQAVEFALDGVTYSIDLSEENHAELREDLARYIEVAQVVKPERGKGAKGKGQGQSKARVGGTQNREQSKAVRDWAQSNGYGVSTRGRIPNEVQQAFDEAHAA